MSQLALSDSFEYMCYGCTAIINSFTLTVWRSNLALNFFMKTLEANGFFQFKIIIYNCLS